MTLDEIISKVKAHPKTAFDAYDHVRSQVLRDEYYHILKDKGYVSGHWDHNPDMWILIKNSQLKLF